MLAYWNLRTELNSLFQGHSEVEGGRHLTESQNPLYIFGTCDFFSFFFSTIHIFRLTVGSAP